MSLSTQPYKGARDFFPEDKRIQNYMFGILREVAESFGYEEYDAPILEPTDIYLQKGNEEIINEQTYTFTDRGGRSVTIRTEMTPTVSRMIAARRQELAYPVRWYSIPNLWRYERTQRGRLREFWQLNVDLFGVPGIEADHENILIADQIMQRFGAKTDMYEIRVNSRKLVNAIIKDYLKMDSVQSDTLIRLIDRIHKIDTAEFIALAEGLMTPSQREAGAVDVLMQILKTRTVDELPAELAKHPNAMEIRQILAMLDASGVTTARFDITLMRGFDYYTNLVFEVFDTSPENRRSLFGGGRYDGLVNLFGAEPIPAVGFGMGDIGLQNFLETHHLLPALRTETDAYVIILGEHTYVRAQRLIKELRAEGARIAVDMTNRKIAAQIKSAEKMGIAYVVFIGEEELREKRFKIKNIITGEEQAHSFERLVSHLEDIRLRNTAIRRASQDKEL